MVEMIKDLLGKGWDMEDVVDFVGDEFNVGCGTVIRVWEIYNNK